MNLIGVVGVEFVGGGPVDSGGARKARRMHNFDRMLKVSSKMLVFPAIAANVFGSALFLQKNVGEKVLK